MGQAPEPLAAPPGTIVIIIIAFIVHWQVSVFFQSFFLHRYGAHQQFTMSQGWERAFHLGTFLAQGSSFLSTRAYAIIHRMHHAYSDTERDPHSPRFYRNAFSMMWATKLRYDKFAYRREEPEPRFVTNVPDWPALDRLSQNWIMRLSWIALYTLFYFKFATAAWMFALLPLHFIMGPIHGAMVNWGGHKYGYRNYKNDDDSTNALPIDFLCMGELFQNNHHKFAMSPNFAVRRFELDPTYPVIRLLAAVGIIQLDSPQKMRYPAEARA
ncbi:MAG: acyl-CoA desaturase [Polyangiaceae bacterium]|nr:acyl-CoA desaturase [Polyangiaceae bacterium]